MPFANETPSSDRVADWLVTASLYADIVDGQDQDYWIGYCDALLAVLGETESLS